MASGMSGGISSPPRASASRKRKKTGRPAASPKFPATTRSSSRCRSIDGVKQRKHADPCYTSRTLGEAFMKTVLLILGIVALVLGLFWAGQGYGLIQWPPHAAGQFTMVGD